MKNKYTMETVKETIDQLIEKYHGEIIHEKKVQP